MISKYFLLDTNVIERDKFRFNYGVLGRTRYLIGQGYLRQLSVKIIRDEVDQHIKDYSTKIVSEYKSFRKSSLMILHSGIEKYTILNTDMSKEEIETEIKGLAKDFYQNAIEVSLELADPDEVFNLYHIKDSPFGNGEKKKEFPDAFFLSAVNNWAIQNEKQVHIVSGDKGVLSYCKDKDNLLATEELRELIQETFDEFTVHTSHDIFDELWGQIEEQLKIKIDELGIISSVDIDSDVNDYEIEEIERIDQYTFDKQDQVITFNCLADVTINADLSIPDPSFTFYDKEDDERHVMDYIDFKHTQTIQIVYIVKFRFDPENLRDYELISVKIDEPSIIDLDEINIYEL